MKNKLGILSALILSLAIAGSVFASSGTTATVRKSSPAAKTAASKTMKHKKHRKHRKHRKHHRAGKMKSADKMNGTMTTTPPK